MNTKQLTYPTIQEQKQFWIDKETVSDNATTETRRDCRHNAMIEWCWMDQAWRCADCGYIYSQTPETLQSDNATNKETTGSASIHIDLRDNIITVTHGDTSDILLQRKVTREFWECHLWPLLEGKRP